MDRVRSPDMKTGFSLNNGIVNWPPLKTRRIHLNGPAEAQSEQRQGREERVLAVVASNLERLKDQVVQTIQRL